MNATFVEKVQIASGFVPVAMNTAANNGDYVSLENYKKCAIVFFKAAGTASDDPTLTVTQATTALGTTNKGLNFTRIDVKQGSDLTTIGTFTEVTQTAASTYTSATSAEEQAIWVVDIDASSLDVENGYDCIRASVADLGTNAQLGCVLYFLHEPRYATDPLVSALVD